MHSLEWICGWLIVQGWGRFPLARSSVGNLRLVASLVVQFDGTTAENVLLWATLGLGREIHVDLV